MELYDRFSSLYDALTEEYYDYLRAAERFSTVIRGKRVLEVAGGTGTLAGLLDRKGFSVTLTDSSASMLEIAREKLRDTDVKIRKADIRTIPPDGVYDAVISHAGVITAIRSDAGLVVESYLPPTGIEEAVKAVYGALDEGGRFIFDILPEHDPDFPGHRFGEFEYGYSIERSKGKLVKRHEIRHGDDVVASGQADHYRMPITEFKDLAYHADFSSMRGFPGDLIVLGR